MRPQQDSAQVAEGTISTPAARLPAAAGAPDATPAATASKRDKLLVSTATRLLPLLELLERIKPHVGNNTVFSSRREKIDAQIALVYEQLKSDQPKRQALTDAFKTLSDFVLEETHEISKDEVKESAKRFVLATLKNAPNLISAAKQAGLLS
ncbi:hypothetical protein K3G63_09130 [Hymenobacter sp. HSC-4F20]|uniref:hypothetical protein n=1 Tax=Hymenobacter sp. HSC-4F20 TaxID=2864135 RepID=UPI001C73AC30|nr:hypothetical protein [Hymenobacter sp. HSC-4F20]MBX0290598.1 hypothetical protein [Hymenobacter sp. HSC-4F20]